MKRFWFQLTLGIGVATALFGLLLVLPFHAVVYAQAVPTDTPTLSGTSSYITQTYTEPINVRTGPSTVSYPVIGQLPVGATAPALARSPSSEWIEIAYPSGPGGIGWIYAANVTLSSQAILPAAEPPPTATPPATATLDPTLEAAFQVQPTVTRLPTFTPPASISTLPTFDNPEPQSRGGFPMAKVIFVFAIAGGLVLLVSLFVRR